MDNNGPFLFDVLIIVFMSISAMPLHRHDFVFDRKDFYLGNSSLKYNL